MNAPLCEGEGFVLRLKRWIGLAAALCLLATMLPGGAALAAAKYYITVDITNQIVTVYDNGKTSDAGIACQFICSTGKSGTSTPTGTYTLPKKSYASERTEWYYFPKYKCYAKWATRIVRGILFHSVLYSGSKVGPTRASVAALGSRASHGCVRLRVNDARWIAQNCPAGTRCKIYYSGKTDGDLRKRLLDHSFYRSKESYDDFMGREETGFRILSRGMEGEKVRELQARLRALGFLNDVVDGKFGENTERAVKYFQKACDLKKTGKVNEALWNAMFAANAPTGTYVTLSEGESGPAVAVLQRGLSDLKLYDGAADGNFDADVASAVTDFQGYYGYDEDGKAEQALQQDVIARAKALKERFGDAEYRLVIVTRDTAMARATRSAKLMAEALTTAEVLAKLRKGAEVEVVAEGGRWTTVRYGDILGYVKTKVLDFFTKTQTTLTYVLKDDPDPTPTPEISLPTPTPSPTPEISLPTPTPSSTPEDADPTPTPSPTPEAVQSAMEEPAVAEVEAALGGAALPRYAVVAVEVAPLYARAGEAEDAVIERLNAGEVLTVVDVLEDWVAVVRGEETAFARAADVILTDAPPETQAEDNANAGALEMGTEPTPEPVEITLYAMEIEGG